MTYAEKQCVEFDRFKIYYNDPHDVPAIIEVLSWTYTVSRTFTKVTLWLILELGSENLRSLRHAEPEAKEKL